MLRIWSHSPAGTRPRHEKSSDDERCCAVATDARIAVDSATARTCRIQPPLLGRASVRDPLCVRWSGCTSIRRAAARKYEAESATAQRHVAADRVELE